MKNIKLFLLFTTVNLIISSCDIVDDAKDTLDALDCAELLIKIDEEYDREDKDCSEISSDIDKILKRCSEFIDAEDRAQLEFYRDNCSDD
ncbi:hypothetical protein B0O79_3165 [Flavobacteriaceae bacterium MAR_2009_75]|nr:hypothetical protein B0O79_3165 [Flavobacteriaceae bacterium MAR_2009_75]